jgi:hypothetical protein
LRITSCSAPFSLLLRARGALFLRLRQRLEALLLLEPRHALCARLEVELERPFDGDLAEAEVGGREDAAYDDLLFPSVLRRLPRFAVL